MARKQLSFTLPGEQGRRLRRKTAKWDIAQGCVIRAAIDHFLNHADEPGRDDEFRKLAFAERL